MIKFKIRYLKEVVENRIGREMRDVLVDGGIGYFRQVQSGTCQLPTITHPLEYRYAALMGKKKYIKCLCTWT